MNNYLPLKNIAMITAGFGGDGHNRNETNRRTQKEINRGRFSKIFGVKLPKLSQKERKSRKLSSDYNRVANIPSAVIFLLILGICALIWLFK